MSGSRYLTFSERALLVLLVGVAVVFLLLGSLLSFRDFAGNLLAELSGIAIGILVAVLFLERYERSRRERQWASVRNYTLGAMAAHLCDLASYLPIYLPIEDHRPVGKILEGRNLPNPVAVEGFQHLLGQMDSVPDSISPDKSSSDAAIEFYEAVTWDLDQIQNVLTPRLTLSTSDQSLIDTAVRFDHVRRGLHNAIIGHRLVVTQSVFPRLVDLLSAASELYRAISRKWIPLSED